MIIFIQIIFIVIQIIFIFINIKKVFVSWWKRRIYTKILKFQEVNLEKLILSFDFSSNNNNNLLDIFNVHDMISDKYHNNEVSYEELKAEFIKLKSIYSEYTRTKEKNQK